MARPELARPKMLAQMNGHRAGSIRCKDKFQPL
jgi:hypothetical protein